MISVKKLQTALSTKSTSEDFFKTHRYLEGYIKRVFLIGLRLQGVQYDNSVKIVDGTYLHTGALIEKVLHVLSCNAGTQRDTILKLNAAHADFFKLKELFLKFTAPYRNRLAHGTIEELKDQELVDWLCHINRAFFKEFEKMLQSEFGQSAFDEPGAWGAKRGIAEAIEVTVKKLDLGRIVPVPMQLLAVKKAVIGTGYELA